MDQERIRAVLQRVADENGITLENVLEEIEKVIDIGMGSRDASIQRNWEMIPRSADRPTVEELMTYLAEKANSIRIPDQTW